MLTWNLPASISVTGVLSGTSKTWPSSCPRSSPVVPHTDRVPLTLRTLLPGREDRRGPPGVCVFLVSQGDSQSSPLPIAAQGAGPDSDSHPRVLPTSCAALGVALSSPHSRPSPDLAACVLLVETCVSCLLCSAFPALVILWLFNSGLTVS